ncbi:MAG: dihydropteroate synthase [Candidatus Gastranaerophilales bacterium]|nr:dihydropteroate synthase [Candidatus Gastranaerophilales bacterium]
MDKTFIIRKVNESNVRSELVDIGFESSYLDVAKHKYKPFILKIYNLTPPQAMILKQTALSLGTDCATHRYIVTCKVKSSDVILFATANQLKKISTKLKLQPFGLKTLAKNIDEFLVRKKIVFKIHDTVFDWHRTYLMGILNITPDSFSDGGKYYEPESAYEHFNKLVQDGADIIDIGGESTRPNFIPIESDEEISRVIPVIKKIRDVNTKTPISIDTRNPKTAQAAIDAGANIINDVSGLLNDKNMISAAAQNDAVLVVAFNDDIKQGKNAIDETIKGLNRRIELCLDAGIKESRIILDPGLGFNKTSEQNIELIKNAREVCSLPFACLYGISRKSFVQRLSEQTLADIEFANVALNSYLTTCGVNILRIHDVKAHKQAVNTLDKVIYD